LKDEHGGAPKADDAEQPPTTAIIPKSQAPRSQPTATESGAKSDPSNDKLDRDLVRWTRMLAFFTGALVLAACLQFWAMYRQLNEMAATREDADTSMTEQIEVMKRQLDQMGISNRINTRMLTINESPSVYFGNTAHFRNIQQPDGEILEALVVTIGNSGASVARGLSYRLACHIGSLPTDDIIAAALSGVVVVRTALTPKAEVTPIACKLSARNVLEINKTRQSVYVFGSASYPDTMDSSSKHLVKFCLRLHDMALSGNGDVGTMQEECNNYNCADNECQAP
jgi:hypothetical protein